ncbi:Pleckstrin homology domain [Trypanosoma melophagium]|uniref:Pleckstrin homology domain n=1 Tax=Trypanosoma melophagium TaxID=715481 RepID=UPI003519EB4D|nr:Pleckstrin homology domain [Trypanosoma melophagium]
MDSLHRAHLERILENRRRRGVLATHANRRGTSTATQTQELELPEKVDASLMKSDLSPIPRRMSDYTMADEAARPVHHQQETQDAAEGSFNDGVRKMGNGNRCDYPGTENRNRFSGNTSSANRRPSQYDDRRFGNLGRDRRRDTYTSSSAPRPSRKSPNLAGRNSYSGRSNHTFSASMSPRRTVPLLKYNSSENSVFSPSRGREGSLRRSGRRTPSRSNYTLPSKRDKSSRPYERRDKSRSDYNSGMSSHGLFGGPSQNNARNGSMGGYQSSFGRSNQNEGNGFLHKFPDDRNKQAAGSVIYTGREDSLGSPYGRQLPEPLLPQASPHSNLERNASMNPNNDAVGLPGTRTTMNLRTSVSILASGDWFYKWNGKGTSVSPRWVWLGTQSHVLLWAHKETYETAFAGTMKLEKILQITSRELQQPDDHGIPRTYYVLLVETSKRVLQLATERREKADAWYEALNNVLLYLRSHNFGVVGATT